MVLPYDYPNPNPNPSLTLTLTLTLPLTMILTLTPTFTRCCLPPDVDDAVPLLDYKLLTTGSLPPKSPVAHDSLLTTYCVHSLPRRCCSAWTRT